MKIAIAASGMLLIAPAVLAQDMPGALDLPTLAHGQVISSTAKGYANRGPARRGHATQRQREACAQKARVRDENGANDPDVRRLYSLCRGVGL